MKKFNSSVASNLSKTVQKRMAAPCKSLILQAFMQGYTCKQARKNSANDVEI